MNLMEALLSAKLGGSGGGGSGMTDDVKQAFLNAFAHVAWTDEHGQDYYDALEAALYPAVGLVGIAALYTQSGTVYDTDSLDSLKSDLVVTATYADNTVRTVTDYTLAGTLTVGTSTITVSYGGKTTTFTVTVTASSGTSDMNGWTDGVAYTNLEIVENQYCKKDNGTFINWDGWDRTGYVPCGGCGVISFSPCPQQESTSAQSCWFYTSEKTGVRNFVISKTDITNVNVPDNAEYFVISSEREALATCIGAGIVPHAPINE